MQLLGWILIEVNFSNSNGTIDENTKNLAKSILFNQVTGLLSSDTNQKKKISIFGNKADQPLACTYYPDLDVNKLIMKLIIIIIKTQTNC